MNIDISDKMIEQILEKQIEEKVKAWFARNENKYVIREYIEKSVSKELGKFDYMNAIEEEAKKLTNKEVLDGVCRKISFDIAEAFADKYSTY